MIDYITDTISREKFFEKIRSKSNSWGSENMARYAIRNLDYYCDDVYHKTTDDILEDLKTDFDESNNPAKVLRFLDDFVSWCAHEHSNITIRTHPNDKGKSMKAKNPKTIKNYFLNVRKYMKLCHGIRLNDDDIGDFVTFPVTETDEDEAEPFTHDEIRNVLHTHRKQPKGKINGINFEFKKNSLPYYSNWRHMYFFFDNVLDTIQLMVKNPKNN